MPPEPAAATCPCGSVWFELQAFMTGDERGLGAVQVNVSGTILATSGIYVCLNCGVPLEGEVPPPTAPARPRLSVVR